MNGLPVLPAHQLAAAAPERRWLIDSLWAEQAVGIVGGEPKCCKSFLALDMAVAVATGTPCLRTFAVPHPGRVLLFAAEDALHVVRQRLEGIAASASIPLTQLDVHVITAPVLRLDQEEDRQRLTATVAALQPKLLILDPFVRLHRVDENASGEVAPLLAFLRELQRGFHLAIVVVHHARKGAARLRAGQALRGSSEFHAWGDSNLYMRRVGEQLSLTIEQRAAPALAPLALHLKQQGPALALELLPPAQSQPNAPQPEPTAAERVTRALASATAPLTTAQLRKECRIRTKTLCALLADLTQRGLVQRTAAGYLLPSP